MATQEPVEFIVQLELRDLLRAQYWNLFRRRVVTLGILLACAAVIPNVWIASHDPEMHYLLVIACLLPCALLIMVGGVYFSAKRALATNRALQEPITYRFSVDGFSSSTPSSSGYTNWESVHQAFETKHDFYIFVAYNIMYVIPKRCCGGSERIIALKDALRQQLGARVRLRAN